MLSFMGRINNELQRSELNPFMEWRCNYVTLKSTCSFPEEKRKKGPLMTTRNSDDRTHHTLSKSADDA